MRRAARTDANHAALVATFRELGACVLQLHGVGEGCPDLLVSVGRSQMLVEVKTEQGRLTSQQRRFADQWPPGFAVARSTEDAVDIVKELRMYDRMLKAVS